MFQKARVKLTSWYLLIIMLISITFSMVIYSGVNGELGRFQRAQEMRLRRERELILPAPLPPELNRVDVQFINAARMRLTLTLILINLGIFGIAGVAGYFLAGRTLKPIQEMVNEQNRFITDASHELRTPLTSLRTSIEVNLRNKDIALDEAKKLMKSNLEDVESLQVLSDGLIKLAYYQKPNGNLNFEDLSLKEIINSAVDRVKAMAFSQKIKINVKAENYKIKGDKKSLIELFTILLDNAIKYGRKNSAIMILANKQDGKTTISVSDKGIGIADQDLPHIFDRFYRAEKSRSKANVSGYGLGLSIAKKIVEAHRGVINVRSEKDKGTTFTVIL
jgi:two-component system, OmpR family, sensor histidine kinase CiaH